MNFTPKPVSRNWSPENLSHGVVLLAASINNVAQALRIINDDKEALRFLLPDGIETFENPWAIPIMSNDFRFNWNFNPSNLELWTGKEILKTYEADKAPGSDVKIGDHDDVKA